MRVCSLAASAKINLHLEILGNRPDGYHELAMVMQSIGLADEIEIRSLSTDTIRVHCSHPDVPTDDRNLAYRAAALIVEEFPSIAQYGGVEITIQKHIPVAAGLAGGSTNAAAVLVGLNLLWKLGLTQTDLQALGAKLGSDVPFCITGGTMLATGRGEQVSPLPDVSQLYVVLAKYRHLAVSTAWAYKTYRQQFGHTYPTPESAHRQPHTSAQSGPIVSALAKFAQNNAASDTLQLGQLLYNDLEKVVLPAHPLVQHLRDELYRQPTLGAMMSGSGPTVFALTQSLIQAQQVQAALKVALPDPDLDSWIAPFTNTSIRVIRHD